MKRKLGVALGILFLVIVSIIIMTTIIGKADVSPNKHQIHEYEVDVLEQETTPIMFEVWGADGVDKINNLAPKAAELIATTRLCNKVDMVMLSEARSKPGKRIVFYVICANKERFFVDEFDIAANAIPMSESKKDKSTEAKKNLILSMCESAIKNSLDATEGFQHEESEDIRFIKNENGSIDVEMPLDLIDRQGRRLEVRKASCTVVLNGGPAPVSVNYINWGVVP